MRDSNWTYENGAADGYERGLSHGFIIGGLFSSILTIIVAILLG